MHDDTIYVFDFYVFAPFSCAMSVSAASDEKQNVDKPTRKLFAATADFVDDLIDECFPENEMPKWVNKDLFYQDQRENALMYIQGSIDVDEDADIHEAATSRVDGYRVNLSGWSTKHCI
jgi:hypothetical protein